MCSTECPLVFPAPTWPHTQSSQCYCLYSLCCTLHPHDCSAAASLHFSLPSPSHPVPRSLYPLATISLFSVSKSLFLFCLFIYIVLWIPHASEIRNLKILKQADYEPVETSNYITLILASIAARPVRTLHEALCMCLVIWTAFEAPTITVLTLAYFSNFVFI